MPELCDLAVGVEPPQMGFHRHRDLATADDAPGVPHRDRHVLAASADRQRLEVGEGEVAREVTEEVGDLVLAVSRTEIVEPGVAGTDLPLDVVGEMLEDRRARSPRPNAS